MEYYTCSDDALLLIFKSGDVRGFNILFDRHWASLFRLARKILEDDDLAKDTVQQVFVSFYEKAHAKEINHVKGYLLHSVKYQCFMHLRSGKINEKHLQRLQTAWSGNYVDEFLDAQELHDFLHQRLESLPERCRQVFYLSRFEMLSNKKIAEQLNISQKTVEHQITKALKTLRLSLDKLVLVVLFLHL